jgi:hypothetical protein
LDNLGLEFYIRCTGARSNILLGAFPREITGLSASVTLALALEVVDVLDPVDVVTTSLRVCLACNFRFFIDQGLPDPRLHFLTSSYEALRIYTETALLNAS